MKFPWFGSVKGLATFVAVITILASVLFTLSHSTQAVPPPRPRVLAPVDMQNLIFVWASGTTSIQQQAAHICQIDSISPASCAAISAEVRSTWLTLMQVDPASLGRVGVRENVAGRAQVYSALAGKLSALTQGKASALLAQSQQTVQQFNASLRKTNPILFPIGTTHYTVWATSFSQTSLPDGLKTKTSPYVALPDAYLKYANWGFISNIPAMYQPFYAPNGTKTHWSVTIALPNGTKRVSNVLVTDVGPWNEDDNWWDANGTSATPSSSCPIATSLIAPDATSNPSVNGICPDGNNLRRMYYYLLYNHGGLPFFQATSYTPSGNFSDGTWPTTLPEGCSEAAVAAVNNDGMTCGGGANGYNAHNGAWLRSGAYDKGITNQSSIDLSPAVNKAVGWAYPSSGFIQVNMSALP